MNLTLHRTVVSENWFAGGYLLSGEGSAGRGSGGPEAVAGRAVDGGGCGGGCHIPEKYKIPYSKPHLIIMPGYQDLT